MGVMANIIARGFVTPRLCGGADLDPDAPLKIFESLLGDFWKAKGDDISISSILFKNSARGKVCESEDSRDPQAAGSRSFFR